MVAALFNDNAALSNRDGPRHCGFLTIWGLGCIEMHAKRGLMQEDRATVVLGGDHVTVTYVQLCTCMHEPI